MANGLTYQRTTTTPEATKQLAATLAPYLHAGDTIVLTGDLGAGKTQFVQGVAAALGVRAAVTSPTFNILLEYHDGRLPLYHYDLYRLGHSPVLDAALKSPELLAHVVAFKEKFYRTPWARLSEAKPGTLKLSPQPERRGELEADYDAMRDMLFGEVPDFNDIVCYIERLESEINTE